MASLALQFLLTAAALYALWNLALCGSRDRLPALAVAGLVGDFGLPPTAFAAPAVTAHQLLGAGPVRPRVASLCRLSQEPWR